MKSIHNAHIYIFYIVANVCTTWSLRLVGGAKHYEGRVELCVGGRWGTVCGEGWTNEDAGHMCTRLGYPMEGIIKNLYCMLSG